MYLSIVTTLYYSENHLSEFCSRACSSAEKLTNDYELILVNDGSPDNSMGVALEWLERNHRIKIIDLSRNFGQHKAMMTGLRHARGDLVFLLDFDLEETPELLEIFHAKMEITDADVVYGVQEKRKGDLFERASGFLFYRLFNFLSSYPIPANLIHARLMSKRYVASLIEHQDRNVYIAGLMAITGFKQEPILVHKLDRGTSTYNLTRKLGMLVNGITSFSSKPLFFILYLGAGILILSGLVASFSLLRGLLSGEIPDLLFLLLISMWIICGLIVFCLGIIAIYLHDIASETKHRPYTIIRKIYSWTGDTE
jgi:putative glycosyltransferase